MGDPKRIRRKFVGPGHPWQKERIEVEKQLLYDYGLKNKAEIWKMNSKMKDFGGQAKRLIASRGVQADKETKQLLARLSSLGLLTTAADLDDVLGLTVENLLDRRLQTVLVKKGLARSQKQARQFITHRHVLIGGKVITSPSDLVRLSEEAVITFAVRSALANDEHPERAQPEVEKVPTLDKPDEVAPDAAKKEAPKKTEKPAKKTIEKKDAAPKPASKESDKKEEPKAAPETKKEAKPASEPKAEPEKKEEPKATPETKKESPSKEVKAEPAKEAPKKEEAKE
jgi:small subunit ribosomal protein S4